MFVKVLRALYLPFLAHVALALFMVFMILAPIFIRISEKANYETIALILAYIGYTWMAFIFLFFIICLFFDIIALFINLTGILLQKDIFNKSLLNRVYFFLALILSTCVVAYGYYEAANIKAEKIIIKSKKIPKDIGKIRLAQISDVHAGTIVDAKRIKNNGHNKKLSTGYPCIYR